MRILMAVLALLLPGMALAQSLQKAQTYIDAHGDRQVAIGMFCVPAVDGSGCSAGGGGGGGTSAATSRQTYTATSAGTGYAVGDYLDHVVTTNAATGAVYLSYWINITQGTLLSAAPTAGSYVQQALTLTGSLPGFASPPTFNLGTADCTGIAAYVTGTGPYNLCGYWRAVAETGNSTAASAVNWTQVAGSAVTVGSGAVTSNVPRFVLTNDYLSTVTDNLNQVGGVALTLGAKASASSIPVVNPKGATSTPTSITASTTVVTALAANAARLGCAIVNESTNILYIRQGAGATTAAGGHSFVLAGSVGGVPGTYVCPTYYTGAITLIWNGTNGAASVTEDTTP